MIKIDIIIVTYSAKDKLKKCIQSLRRHTRTFEYQLAVVNNNSTDGTSKFLKKYNGKINIINNERNFGFSKAANIGIKNTLINI